jgi:hypothetical protein
MPLPPVKYVLEYLEAFISSSKTIGGEKVGGGLEQLKLRMQRGVSNNNYSFHVCLAHALPSWATNETIKEQLVYATMQPN